MADVPIFAVGFVAAFLGGLVVVRFLRWPGRRAGTALSLSPGTGSCLVACCWCIFTIIPGSGVELFCQRRGYSPSRLSDQKPPNRPAEILRSR